MTRATTLADRLGYWSMEAGRIHDECKLPSEVTPAEWGQLRDCIDLAIEVLSAPPMGEAGTMGGGDVIALVEPSRWDHPTAPQLAYANGYADARAQPGSDGRDTAARLICEDVLRQMVNASEGTGRKHFRELASETLDRIAALATTPAIRESGEG